MKVRYAAQTDVGRHREHNEDSVLVVREHLLFIVADGMGGHASGEVASKMAVDVIAEELDRSKARSEPLEERLRRAIEVANQRVFAKAKSSRALRGMGTTVVVAAVDAAGICIAHVGDSRAYRIRAGSIERLTQDHSLVEMLKLVGTSVTEEVASGEPPKNVILRAVGIAATVSVDIRREAVLPNDRFVLCSDGLSGMVDDNAIRDSVVAHVEPRTAVADLIRLANTAGGADNVTAVVIAFVP